MSIYDYRDLLQWRRGRRRISNVLLIDTGQRIGSDVNRAFIDANELRVIVLECSVMQIRQLNRRLRGRISNRRCMYRVAYDACGELIDGDKPRFNFVSHVAASEFLRLARVSGLHAESDLQMRLQQVPYRRRL